MTEFNFLSSFGWYFPTRIRFGVGVTGNIVEELQKEQAKNVLIVTDKGIKGAGLLDKIVNLLGDNFQVSVFDSIEPNPRSDTMEKCIAKFKDSDIDTVIGLGGGSPMDSAKAIAVRFTNPGNVKDYTRSGGQPIKNRPATIVAIPTTSGTGSEVTFGAMITDEVKHLKLAIFTPDVAPTLALIDPEMTVTLPAKATAETGIDALTHALEAYTSRIGYPITDAIAIRAIELVGESLRQAVGNGGNIVARSKMMLASTMAGMAFTNGGLGIAHSMGHPLSGELDLPHGLTCGVMLPYVMEWNIISCPQKFADVARALGVKTQGLSVIDAAKKSVDAVLELLRDLDIPTTLKDSGVKKSELPQLIEDCKLQGAKANPRVPFGEREIKKIYERAFE